MPDYQNANKTELSEFEQQDQFLLQSTEGIVHVLKDLSRKPDIITGYFENGRRYILTAVIKVLPERGLVVLDEGPDESGNLKLLEEGRLLCVTKHNRIHIKFTLNGVQKARLRGESVLAAPLPESVFRLQRREFFRIRTPLATPVTCEVPWIEGREELKVVDLGYGGLALEDAGAKYKKPAGEILEDCGLHLPDFGQVELALEIRNIIPQKYRDGSPYNRIGCQFRQLPLDRSAIIQRYIHQLQVEHKQFGGD